MQIDKLNMEVYNPNEIKIILKLSRSTLYTFLDEVYRNQKPFKVLKVGKLYKIPKDSFDNWVKGY